MSGYRVLVTGSRSWTDYGTVQVEIGQVVAEQMALTGEAYPRITVVHGAARGADSLAAKAAADYRLDTEPHPADWRQHGKRAGMIRNAEMVNAGADVCLAFIRDTSPGATHCANLAEKCGIPVRRFTDTAEAPGTG